MYRRKAPRRKRRILRFFTTIMLVLLLAGGAAGFNYLRPLPAATATPITLASDIDLATVAWPANTQAAIGALGFGTLDTHGSQSPIPMASISKLVTALAILEQKPIKPGEQGPSIELTQKDAALFDHYYALGGSVTKVEAGKHLTEYQMLQAMLLPSSNNAADALATWAFGSMGSYHAYANKMLERYGLKHTSVAADASGFSPQSLSTADDLVRLGERALRQPVITEIVSQRTASIPVAGNLRNANLLLGNNGITGIKVGLTDQAGGCYLFAAKTSIGGQPLTIIGAILHAHDLPTAMQGAPPLIESARKNFVVKTPVVAGQTFGTYTTPWGASSTMVAKTNITIVSWKGVPLTPHLELQRIQRAVPQGDEVGSIVVSSGGNNASTPIILQNAIPAPPHRWRLLRFSL